MVAPLIRIFCSLQQGLRRQCLLFLLAVFSCSVASAADISFRIDRDSVALGESFQLLGEKELSNGTFRGKTPDFKALYKDFDVVSYRSPGSGGTFSFGGNMRTLLKWSVVLRPKRSGTLTLPSVVIGGERTPVFQIKVGPRRNAIPEGKLEAIFVVNDMPTNKGFVQEHLTYSVRLYAVKNYPLESAEVTLPPHDDLLMVPMGEHSSYEVTFGRYNFQVFEWLYAVVPQTAGPLEMAAPTVTANVLQANGLFQETVSTERPGKPLLLNIAAAKQQPWRPAQDLSLSWKIDKQDGLKVGEGFTLELVAKGKGMLANQLPQLTLPEFAGLKVYPAKPATSERAVQGVMHSEYRQKWAVVPMRGGEIQLPSVAAGWWSLPQDKAMQAVAKAVTLNVTGTAAVVAAATAEPSQDVSVETPAAAPPSLPIQRLWWLLPLWLLSLVITAWLTKFWLGKSASSSNRVSKVPEPVNLQALKKQFSQAWKVGDSAAVLLALEQAQRLLASEARDQGQRVSALERRAEQLGAEAAAALLSVQQARYGTAAQQSAVQSWNSQAAVAALLPLFEGPKTAANTGASSQTGLAPLYSA